MDSREVVDMTWEGFGAYLLALTIWREARGCTFQVKVAVGCSVRNRVIRASWWGHDYASVLTKKWQYSSVTATGDPQLSLYPKSPTDQNFDECMDIAGKVINHQLPHPLLGADSYFDDSISPPPWATPDLFVGKLDRMNFYNVDKDIELPSTALRTGL